MQFQKGQKKTPGSGRKAGTPNKSTQIGAGSIMEFLTEYKVSGKMSQDWLFLEPKDRIYLAVKMMNYIIPKRAAVQAEVNATVTDRNVEDTLIELAGE